MKAFLKKIYFKYLNPYSIKTVHVRGRLTEAEEDLYANAYGKSLFNDASFSINSKNILEIGFGNGQHLVQLAQDNLETKVVGVELYKAGIVKVLKEIENNNFNNLTVVYGDAREVMSKLEEKVLDQLFVLFPDPWPKLRHHKRRLLQKDFIKNCVEKLKLDGVLYIATDWENYAEEIEKVLIELANINILQYLKLLDSPISKNVLQTTFAKRAQKEGREITIFSLRK